MALNLKNPRTLAAIDELAALTGQSKAEAVASAVEARIAEVLAAQRREPRALTEEERLARIMALCEDTAARFRAAGAGPDAEGRFPDLTAELYGDDGLPV